MNCFDWHLQDLTILCRANIVILPNSPIQYLISSVFSEELIISKPLEKKKRVQFQLADRFGNLTLYKYTVSEDEDENYDSADEDDDYFNNICEDEGMSYFFLVSFSSC